MNLIVRFDLNIFLDLDWTWLNQISLEELDRIELDWLDRSGLDFVVPDQSGKAGSDRTGLA